MLEIKGFITNLGKYNEGELVGKWIAFPIDEDELNEVFREIGMNYEDEEGELVNTGYEEYFFTDWECAADCNLNEYESIVKINELAEQLEAWEDEADKFKAACEVWGFDYVIEKDPDNYNLYCDINTDEDLGYYWAVESGCYNLDNMGSLANYIDYERFGRDIRFESDGGFSDWGWVEYVG